MLRPFDENRRHSRTPFLQAANDLITPPTRRKYIDVTSSSTTVRSVETQSGLCGQQFAIYCKLLGAPSQGPLSILCPTPDCPGSLHFHRGELACHIARTSGQNLFDTSVVADANVVAGTIGRRKGVISTHRNYIARIEGYGSRGDMQSQSHISFCLVPMFHIYGFFYTVSSITVGATSVAMPKFDLEEMFSPVQKYKQIGLEGAPLGKNVIEEFGAQFLGIQVTQVYELTESSDAISFTKMNERIRNYGTTGSLNANVEE
eukprot:Gb_13519 [translate_table: standard]